jgi:LysM repeat protein
MSVRMNLGEQNRALDLAQGVLSLVGAAALVVGVPAALLAWVGSPLPAGLPSWSELTQALRDSHVPGDLLVKALAVVCWLVWIELVASLLVEAVAYARGRRSASVPLAGGLQRGAARLVAGIALLGVLVATRGGPEPGSAPVEPLVVAAHPVAAVVTGDAGVGHTAAALPDTEVAARAQEPAPTYEVQRRDTLWDIAERHLGDPLRWPEIFQLNEGCPQADGGCLSDPDLIHAGWRLQLPGDAVGVAPTPDATASGSSQRSPAPPDTVPAAASATVDAGMVLIDDGAGGLHVDDGVLAAGASAASVHETAGSPPDAVGTGGSTAGGVPEGGPLDGMVLLPDRPGPAPADGSPAPADGSTTLAGPADHEGQQMPQPTGIDSAGDEDAPDEWASGTDRWTDVLARPADD